MNRVVVRDIETSAWMAITIEGATISHVEPATPPDGPVVWACPAFWDLQMNGRWGVSFSDSTLTVDQIAAIVRAQAELGTARVCPTLITAPFEAMRHGVAMIAEACDTFPDVDRMVLGIHLEGPSISEVDGYRGAHPRDAVRGPDWDEFEQLQSASGGRIVLITLAPERPGAIGFIKRAVQAGVVIGMGHTAADAETLNAAIEAGATLSTHLGNGIASPLARHPNPIWTQAADDRLMASFIADGHHLDRAMLRVLLRAKAGRAFLVSDASPLAGLPVGRYGDWAVDPSGKILVAGTPYLAGASRGLEYAINEVLAAESMLATYGATDMVNLVPARVLGRGRPNLHDVGEPANLVRFHLEGRQFRLVDTCVDGRWVPRGEATAPSGIAPSLDGQ